MTILALKTEKSDIALLPLIVLCMYMPIAATIAPKSMALLFPIFGTLAIFWHIFKTRTLPIMSAVPLLICSALPILGIIFSSFSLDVSGSIEKPLKLLSLILLTFILLGIKDLNNRDIVSRLRTYIAIGLFFGLIVYAMNVLLDNVIYDIFNPENIIDHPGTKHTKAAFILVMWWILSLAPIGSSLFRGEKLASTITLWLLINQSESTTTIYILNSLILSIPIVVAFAKWGKSRILFHTMLVSIVTFTLLMPFIFHFVSPKTEWRTMGGLPTAVYSRLQIWEMTSSRTFEKPIIGWGFDASKHMPNRGEMSYLYDGIARPVVHLHPHNSALQIWFEQGLIGCLIFCLSVIYLFMLAHRKLSSNGIAFVTIIVASFCLFSLPIWGIWQGWFFASLCFTAFMATIFSKASE